jgi:hypothetical protein
VALAISFLVVPARAQLRPDPGPEEPRTAQMLRRMRDMRADMDRRTRRPVGEIDHVPEVTQSSASCSPSRRLGVVAALALLLALATLSACVGRAQPIEPLVVGWERVFRLEWEVAHRGGQPVVRGSLTNDSPYTVLRVQLLVEALDANGAVVAQEITWATADVMTPSTRASFEIRAPASASTYQVRVFAFDGAGGGE